MSWASRQAFEQSSREMLRRIMTGGASCGSGSSVFNSSSGSTEPEKPKHVCSECGEWDTNPCWCVRRLKHHG